MGHRFFLKYCLILCCTALPALILSQTSQGLIYGQITLKNGTKYQGQIRLGNQEALWDDVFNVPKHDRHPQKVLVSAKSRQSEDGADDFKLGFMELWEDKIPNSSFPFRCNFGDMVSLEVPSEDLILLTLKNGENVKLKNGRGGDLNKQILIFNNELGKLSLNFKDIQSIKFEATPIDYHSPLGDPVYAKILTTMGVFEGYITWDMEECLGKDLISGKQKGVKVDLEFADIAELKAQNDGSMIKLKSGQTIFLNDHDDVSKGNHGIMIRNLAFGKLILKWENFISARFLDPPVAPASYDDFAPPEMLRGTVDTKSGYHYEGQIIYDLDEIYDIEFLNGKNNGFEYYITFRALAKVEPQNDKFSMAFVKDGRQFLLGGSGDVDANNHGLILRLADERIKYIDWKDLKTVNFE